MDKSKTKQLNSETGFGEAKYNAKLKEIELNTINLERCLSLSLELTGNNIVTYDITELGEFLIKESGFKSPSAIASLNDQKNEYAEFEKLSNDLKSIIHFYDIKPYLKERKVIISESAVNEFRESLTERLNDEQEALYNELKTAVNALNKHIPNQQVADVISRKIDGFQVTPINVLMGFNWATANGYNFLQKQ